MAKDTHPSIKHLAIYQVFTRNFSQEGNFAQLEKKLTHIKNMGFDILYLTPVHEIGKEGRKGEMGSPYAVYDYYSISKELGNEKDFVHLIEEAHKNGLKIMMDIVFNHTSNDSVLVKEHPDWFIKDAQGKPSRKIADWSDVCDLDFAKNEVREYLIKNLEYWADKGVDGFRCDVASLVPLDFWVDARKRLRSQKDVILLAESVEKNFIKYLRDQGHGALCDTEIHDAFDVSYDYDGFEYLKAYFRGEAPLSSYLNHLYIQETLYPAHAIKARFLENHDNKRAASIFTSIDSLKNWTAFSFLLEGIIFAYAGQEMAIATYPNLFDKQTVPWEKGNLDFNEWFVSTMKTIRSVKKEAPLYTVKELRTGIITVERKGKDSEYLAILNLEDKFGDISINKPIRGFDVFTNKRVDFVNNMQVPKLPMLIKIDAEKTVV